MEKPCDHAELWKKEPGYSPKLHLTESKSGDKLVTFIQRSPEPPLDWVYSGWVLEQSKGLPSVRRKGPMSWDTLWPLSIRGPAQKPCHWALGEEDESPDWVSQRETPGLPTAAKLSPPEPPSGSLPGQDVCLSSLPTGRAEWKWPFFPHADEYVLAVSLSSMHFLPREADAFTDEFLALIPRGMAAYLFPLRLRLFWVL